MQAVVMLIVSCVIGYFLAGTGMLEQVSIDGIQKRKQSYNGLVENEWHVFSPSPEYSCYLRIYGGPSAYSGCVDPNS